MSMHYCTDTVDGTKHICVCPIGHDHTDEEFYQDERNQK